jgi:hypothetical protein
MTKKKFFDTLIGIIAAIAALFLGGCGGDSSSGSTAVVNPNGPTDAAAFAGTTIEINPTINFLTGGALTYYNVVAGTTFPGASIPVAGTYTYTPGSTYATGTLVMTMPLINATVTVTLSGFNTQNGRITSFTTSISGQNFATTVKGGTLTPAPVNPTTGGTSGSSGSGGTTPTGGTAIGGTDLIFSTSASDAPYTNGQRVAFTFTKYADNTQNTLLFSGKTLTRPTVNTVVVAPYAAYNFADGTTTYEVIIKDGTSIHEINVMVNSIFKGQFAAASSSSGGTSGTGGSGGTSGATNVVTATQLYYHPNASVSVTQPYTLNQPVGFTLTEYADTSRNTLSFAGKTLTAPTFQAPTPPYTTSTYTDSSAGLTYQVIVANNTTFQEIIVSNSTTWIGQFSATNTSAGSGSGGSSTPAGSLAAGTSFTRTVSVASVAPSGPVPSGVPSYTTGQQVTFTVNSAGALTFGGLTVPFSADGGTSWSYVEVLSPGNSNTVIVTKNLTTGAPGGVAIQCVRVVTSVPPVVTMVNYTLN